MNPEVDLYLSKAEKWQEELGKLRRIVLDCGLTEEWKWRNPCYTFESSNIVLLGGGKQYCALSFFKGALLKDAHDVLVQQTENMQAARQIRFTSVQQIAEMEAVVKAYIAEAVEVEKAGLKVDFKPVAEFIIPEEFQNKLDEVPTLRTAFEALTPGRQRGYILHFSTAIQSKTRASRIEKCTQLILDGKGLKDCTCGLSQKMPNCDGSHKNIR